MFNKEDQIGNNNAETIIGPSINVKGNFHGQGDIVIEGSVEGEISTKNFLSVGIEAKIIANIKAKNAKIAGLVRGNIVCNNYLEILKTAKITGDISCQEISIEKGAKITGLIQMEQKLKEDGGGAK